MWLWTFCAGMAHGGKIGPVLAEVLDDPALSGATVGAVVHDASGRELYGEGADARLVPASVLKWLTAVAATHELGLDWRFETRLVVTGWLEGDVLHGDVVWIGGGDPTLGEEDPSAVLAAAADVLAAAGVRTLDGDVVVDASVLADPTLGAGWMWDDVGYGFSAPFSGLMLGHAQGRRGLEACEVQGGPGSPLVAPATCAAQALRERLRDVGVDVTGEARLGAAPANGVVAATWHSEPLSELLTVMLQDSDNLYAESIARALDREPPRRFADAREVLDGVLEASGVEAEGQRLVDGSGLSRYDLVTADALVAVAEWAVGEHPELRELLAVPGAEGTLSSRLEGLDVSAKTGSMSGVRNIVGFVRDADGELLCFAILFNGLLAPQGPAIAVQDRAIEVLALSRKGRIKRRDRIAILEQGG